MGDEIAPGDVTGAEHATERPTPAEVEVREAPAEPAAPGKPADPPRSSWTVLAEREAALVEAKRRLGETEKAVAERAGKLEKLEAALAKAQDDPLAVLEAAGLSAETVLKRHLEVTGLKQESPEDVQRRIVREEMAAAEQKTKLALDTKAAQEQATMQQAIAGYQDAVEREFNGARAEFDMLTAFEVTSEDVWRRAYREFGETGKLPLPGEALKLLEEDLATRAGKTKRFGKPADPADKTNGAKDSAPRTVTARAGGEVSVKPKPAQKLTAFERLEAAKRELGVG